MCTPESYGPFRGSSATGVDMCCVRSASNGGITGRQCCENKYKENFGYVTQFPDGCTARACEK